MSIRVRFTVLIVVISLISAILFALLSYRFTINNAFEEAKRKGNIVFTFIESSRTFFREKQRTQVMKIVDKDRFYPNLMSGFAVTRGIWDEFAKELPDYTFKQATIDPLYPPNKANRDELALIMEFNHNPDLKTKEGVLDKDGEKYFYFARPVKVGKKCLRCHGDPADAPQDQIEIYGRENGYNWKEGQTVASFITYVPIQNAIEEARKAALTLFAMGIAAILMLVLFIMFFLNRYLVKPIRMLETRTTEISLGKELQEKIDYAANDEIGALARAIDRMRISTQKLLDRYSKK